MGKIKHTKENIAPIIKGCVSVMSGIAKMGIKGGNRRLHRLIKEVLIKDGTYIGQGHNKNKRNTIKSNDEYFSNSDVKRTTFAVRNSLFERGLKERKCERCGLSKWLNKPIPLEVHHKDGIKLNNELINLEILCPNCHYFTDTYKTKNRGVVKM